MIRIQFGWSLPGGPRNNITRTSFLAATKRGLDLINGHFDSAWLTDHLQFENRPILEGWTTLTYLAALYPHLNFGHAVLCQSFRNPALLAKMAATLQYMSEGRFILGIGAGWKEDEYRAYGYPFPGPRTRIDELEETLQIINALWNDERATVRGKHYQVVDAYCEPKPDPRPVVMVGGSKPRMLSLIARYADWWSVSWTGLESYREQVNICRQACAEINRDMKTLRQTWFGGCVCAPTETMVRELNAVSISPENAFVGTPDQIVEQMRPFIDLGVDYFMLNCGSFPDLTTLEMLTDKVLPTLNGL
ncbi:MAG TPA: LLM class flavin-dependent oxidoreductase [Ktedonobacteraceae bacterium]|nr:LLM class flavin-dependent oxidoreductase [Ktedonobacteraceae bacterium]